MRKFTQEEFDKFPIVNGVKQCPTGDYTEIKVFDDGCRFGERCKFSKGSRFGTKCSFDKRCKFGKACIFDEGCRFGERCRFGGLCRGIEVQ